MALLNLFLKKIENLEIKKFDLKNQMIISRKLLLKLLRSGSLVWMCKTWHRQQLLHKRLPELLQLLHVVK
jgi:hypothetical protein